MLKIPYDNKQVIKDIVDRGLLDAGHWFVNSNIKILLTGIDQAAILVDRAGQLSAEAGETGVWPHIKQTYFAMAAKELQIPDYRLEFMDTEQTERGKEC